MSNLQIKSTSTAHPDLETEVHRLRTLSHALFTIITETETDAVTSTEHRGSHLNKREFWAIPANDFDVIHELARQIRDDAKDVAVRYVAP